MSRKDWRIFAAIAALACMHCALNSGTHVVFAPMMLDELRAPNAFGGTLASDRATLIGTAYASTTLAVILAALLAALASLALRARANAIVGGAFVTAGLALMAFSTSMPMLALGLVVGGFGHGWVGACLIGVLAEAMHDKPWTKLAALIALQNLLIHIATFLATPVIAMLQYSFGGRARLAVLLGLAVLWTVALCIFSFVDRPLSKLPDAAMPTLDPYRNPGERAPVSQAAPDRPRSLAGVAFVLVAMLFGHAGTNTAISTLSTLAPTRIALANGISGVLAIVVSGGIFFWLYSAQHLQCRALFFAGLAALGGAGAIVLGLVPNSVTATCAFTFSEIAYICAYPFLIGRLLSQSSRKGLFVIACISQASLAIGSFIGHGLLTNIGHITGSHDATGLVSAALVAGAGIALLVLGPQVEARYFTNPGPDKP